VPAEAQGWDYDPTGNWRGYETKANGSVVLDQSRVHDKGNRLTQIEGAPNPVLLDKAGRMREVSPDAAGNWNQSMVVKWDAWSRVTQVRRKSDGAVLGTYTYDGLTRRPTQSVGGTTTHTYYSDAWRPLEERLNNQTTAARQYYWGARHRDDLVRRDRATSECDFTFAFQGQFLDAESGFLNYGYRYYSPHLGRWFSKDPIAERGGNSLYAYSNNAPTNFVDLFGRAFQTPQWQCLGALTVTLVPSKKGCKCSKDKLTADGIGIGATASEATKEAKSNAKGKLQLPKRCKFGAEATWKWSSDGCSEIPRPNPPGSYDPGPDDEMMRRPPKHRDERMIHPPPPVHGPPPDVLA